jgi:hypothetical protein
MRGEQTKTRSELISHGVIAGVVTVTIAVIELRTHIWLSQGLGDAFVPVVLAAGFVLAFAAIYFIDSFIDRRFDRAREAAAKAPIRLPKVGCVDGEWLDVIWSGDERHPSRGGVITIASTEAGGFEIAGRSYDLRNFTEPVGIFEATTTVAQGSLVLYHYAGHEGELLDDAQAGRKRKGKQQGDSGVGYYQFWWDDTGCLRFTGAFLALSLAQPVRYVSGRRIASIRKDDDRLGLLKDYAAEWRSKRDSNPSSSEADRPPPGA